MKKSLIILVVAAVLAGLILAIGCTSPASKAQKMFNEGKYEEVIAQYGSDPNVAAVVTQAKEKLAEKLVAEGKYDVVVQMYPETAAAKMAQEKLAEQLFNAKDYAGVIAKYSETTWAAKAKAEMDKAALQPPGGGAGGGSKPGQGVAGGVSAEQERSAEAEFQRIMGIKMKDLRTKGLREFVAKPEYASTKAVGKAQAELNK